MSENLETAGSQCAYLPFVVAGSPHSQAKIEISQYLQGHTILRTLVNKFADVPVLALGGKNNRIRSVVEG